MSTSHSPGFRCKWVRQEDPQVPSSPDFLLQGPPDSDSSKHHVLGLGQACWPWDLADGLADALFGTACPHQQPVTTTLLFSLDGSEEGVSCRCQSLAEVVLAVSAWQEGSSLFWDSLSVGVLLFRIAWVQESRTWPGRLWRLCLLLRFFPILEQLTLPRFQDKTQLPPPLTCTYQW